MSLDRFKTLSNEFKVGVLALLTAIFALVFIFLMGVNNPFRKQLTFYVTYNYAGGLEVGSPVRVSGIKVGKVESIQFFTDYTPKDQEQLAQVHPESVRLDSKQTWIPVKIKVSVQRQATRGIRRDSQFFINLAGLIGERYVEITPGSPELPEVKAGDVLAGVDPPRIDQLFSQSFDLAGKIIDIVEKNKGDISKSIETLYRLSLNLTKSVEMLDRSQLFRSDLGKLMNNLIGVTADIRMVTEKIPTPEGQKTLKLLNDLIKRLEPMDQTAVKKFLQEEGIRAKIF